MSQASDAHLFDSLSTMTAGKPDLLLSLPDVPTLAILSLLPLGQLIVNVPLVHPHLAPFRQSVLKATQRLVLHIGDQKKIKELQFNSPLRLPFANHLVDSTGALLYPQTDFSTLHLATLNEHSVKQLTSLMPGIVHLKVAIDEAPTSVLPQLTNLLSNWAPTLKTLQLTIGDIDGLNKGATSWEERKAASSSIVSHLRSLIQEINNKLIALQTLTLDIGNAFYEYLDEFLNGGQTGDPLRLSILDQLREFNLSLGYCPRAPNFLLDQLQMYATDKLTRIGLGGDFAWNVNQVANSPFAARFTIVPFNRLSTSNTPPLLRSFTNLTVYGFDWKELHALDLAARLQVLSSLSHLQCFKILLFSNWPTISQPLPAPFPDLPSLPSVTVLEISIYLEAKVGHNYLQAPYWATLFPSVQILKVNHCGDFCAICYPDDGFAAKIEILDYAPVTPCLKQLLAPLAVLSSLRKIFYQRERQCENIAEFTPQGEFVRTHEYIG